MLDKTQRYVIWLKGFLDACDDAPSHAQTEIIKGVLNNLFEHVAEPPKTSETIEVSNTPKQQRWNSNTIYKC